MKREIIVGKKIELPDFIRRNLVRIIVWFVFQEAVQLRPGHRNIYDLFIRPKWYNPIILAAWAIGMLVIIITAAAITGAPILGVKRTKIAWAWCLSFWGWDNVGIVPVKDYQKSKVVVEFLMK